MKLRLKSKHGDYMMTSNLQEQIYHYLPLYYREAYEWELVYSTLLNGTSINTLLSLQVSGGLVMVIKTLNSNLLFGSFLTERIHLQKGYYGNGHCFLFKQKSNDIITVFMSTGCNENYILSQPREGFAFGGGGLGFGLWVDNEMLHGYSNNCDTYNNTILSSGDGNFEIENIEFWSLCF